MAIFSNIIQSEESFLLLKYNLQYQWAQDWLNEVRLVGFSQSFVDKLRMIHDVIFAFLSDGKPSSDVRRELYDYEGLLDEIRYLTRGPAQKWEYPFVKELALRYYH